MKKIQFIINLFFITSLLVFLLNFLLGWVWEFRTKIKFKNFDPYDKVVLKAINLSKEDGLTL